MIVNFSTVLTEETKLNPLVSRFKAHIAKETKANGFLFSKEVLDNANMKLTIPSSPVVAGFLDCDDGSKLGGHTYDLVKINGSIKRTPMVRGIGYVLDKEPWWEIYEGEEWLTCYVNIWTSYFEGLSDLSRRNIYQSMEISMQTDENNNKVVTDCYLNALCMLENVKPAFDGSTFEEITFSKQDFSSEVLSLKQELDSLNNSSNNNDMKGSETKNMAKFSKVQKEEFSSKFSMTVNQIKDTMNDLCSAIKYEYENRECTKYYIWDFDDTYMYGYDSQDDNNIAIPFTVDSEGNIKPDFENAKKAKSTSIWIVSDDENYETSEDDSTYGSFSNEQFTKIEAKCAEKVTTVETKLSETETKLSETETKLSECEVKLTDTNEKMGKQFAVVTSLETALADEKATSESRQAEIDNLSEQLKAKETDEKMSVAKELMSKKEFSVFDEKKKEEILKFSETKSTDEFEILAYAELGKFAGTNLEFNSENGKFSYMYVPNNATPNKKKEADDVFAELRKKKWY